MSGKPTGRPRTGFKQKNPQELTNVNINEIEKYVDLLYEKPEDKIKGARFLLYLVPVSYTHLTLPTTI